MKVFISASVFALACLLSSQAQVAIHPTTTLTALTANNTSASSTYRGEIGGNAAPGNVSKLPLRTLLYSGATTRIYAHLMGWFGGTGHLNVGYGSSDPAQIRNQIDDMVSRGIDGVIASWDTNAMIQQTVPLVLQEAERHAGFEFAIEFEEFGFRQYAGTVGCDITQKVIDDLTQASTQFENSSSYMRINGRPVVFFFGLEKYYVDWSRVRAEAPGNPLLIFRNSGAFAKTYSDGGFAWSDKSKTDPYDEMLGYLDDFYKAALASPAKVAFGSAYAGFNDSLASWGQNKILDRHCGQSWLDSFARAGRFYSSSKQLAALRLVTWNDYEEGTAIEPGVDNCVTVSAGLSGSSTLRWSITGNANTLDHFTVYASTDGENLMPLKDVAASASSLDLASIGFSPGSYVLYVRAVAKAGILNKISGPIKFVPGNQPPTATLSVSSASGAAPLNVSASTSGSSDPDGTVASSTIDFGDGTMSPGPAAQHTYSTPGTYTLQATVYDNAGVASTTSRQVMVNPISPGVVISSPDAGATQPSPIRVQASVASARPIQDMSIWIDGARAFTTFTAQADRKFEVKDGQHVIEVQATDINGTVLQATRNLVTQTPDLPPSADLSVTSFSGGAPNQVLACTAGSSDPDDSIASYLVDFGDGINGSGVSLVHTYQNVGTYNVKATVTDSRGTSSTSVQTVTVGSVTSSGAPAPFRLTATPESASAGSGDSATYIIQAISQSGDFSGEVTLSCSGVPAGLACGFDPVQIKPGANGGTSNLVISSLKTASGTRWRMPFSALSLPIFGMTLLASDPRRRKRLRVRFLPLLIFLAALAIFSTSCGGGGSTTTSQKIGSTFNITVLGTSGSMQSFTTVQYTLR